MTEQEQETPVYLFLGFLESGKTKFIQETLEDDRMDSGENTLLLVCEEGIEEFDPKRFRVKNVFIESVDETTLTEAHLAALQKQYRAERVMVEYNGVWEMQKFFEAMPEGWALAQIMTFIDSATFLNYNANMRQLVYDKIQYAELVVFNRFTREMDKLEFHKIVRGISRRTDIVYEFSATEAEYDDIEDPLPFDIDAPVIEIADRDYALFYRDFMEDVKKYVGKTVRFKGMVGWDKRFDRFTCVIGRHVMTCCEADIAYHGMVMKHDGSLTLQTREWLDVTAKVTLAYHSVYKRKGPVLVAAKLERSSPPDPELATFY